VNQLGITTGSGPAHLDPAGSSPRRHQDRPATQGDPLRRRADRLDHRTRHLPGPTRRPCGTGRVRPHDVRPAFDRPRRACERGVEGGTV